MASRRRLLAQFGALGLAALGPRVIAGAEAFGVVTPRRLDFPRDHGAHPAYRTEWWYLTGWLDGDGGPLGFQVTFFRVRPGIADDNPSAFAARQLLLAHAALSDPAEGALLHDERLARTGFGWVDAATTDTDLRLEGWSLRRSAGTGHYVADVAARAFTLSVDAEPTQPLILQGEGGYSAKGDAGTEASYYYSAPQLQVRATVERDGRRRDFRGRAWLDHEWSSTLLAPTAAGWDWVGMNLDDGSSLTAFCIRSREPGAAPLRTYGMLRPPGGVARVHGPEAVSFRALSTWTSPRTRATWPVAQEIRVGGRTFRTEPLLADQELDSRRTTGAVYWEGASRLYEDGRAVGRGYLEMTGYVEPLRL